MGTKAAAVFVDLITEYFEVIVYEISLQIYEHIFHKYIREN